MAQTHVCNEGLGQSGGLRIISYAEAEIILHAAIESESLVPIYVNADKIGFFFQQKQTYFPFLYDTTFNPLNKMVLMSSWKNKQCSWPPDK